MILKDLINVLKKKISIGEELVDISNISYGPYLLYANFLHDDDDSVLMTPVLKLLTDAISSGDIEDEDYGDGDDDDDGRPREYTEDQLTAIDLIKSLPHVDLTVLVEDPETGEEAELPPVRIKWWKGL